MSIKKISSSMSAFIVSLCLTGCTGPTNQVHETQPQWETRTHAKNKISVEKTMPQESQEHDIQEDEPLEESFEKEKLD